MDNFETLSNDELRLKLLEYGFQNLPVTSTTRKVLIKKLRNHIDSEKSKTRRETIHLTKYSSDEESENENAKNKITKTNRRATINLTEITQPTKNPQSRRSGRITPLSKTDIVSSTVPTVPDIIEDTDEEENIKKQPVRRSKSKTPTLSQTDTVTISVQHIKPSLDTVDEIIERTEVHEDFIQPRSIAQTKYDNLSRPTRQSPVKNFLSMEKLESTNYSQPMNYPDVSEINKPTLFQSGTRKRMTISGYGGSKYIEEPTSYIPKPTTPPRKSTASLYNRYDSSRSSTGYNYKYNTNDFNKYNRERSDEEDDININGEKVEPKYLSEFTKRLSQLRAEPLVSTDKLRKEILSESHTDSVDRPSYQRVGVSTRKSVRKSSTPVEDDSITGHFSQIWDHLNRKYKLNQKIIITFFILLIIFIIVLVFF